MKLGPLETHIMPVKAYRIRRKWRSNPALARYSYSYFTGTRQQCALRLAWWWIMEKYPNINAIDQVGTLECDCLGDNYSYKVGEERCPLHNRHWGYFKRLADRLATRIVATWPEAETAT